MFVARASTALRSSPSSSSSSCLLLARATFSTTPSLESNPGKNGPSTMGISKKARTKSAFFAAGGGKVAYKERKRMVSSPHLEGGHLQTASLESLISLYHAAQNFVTRETLDETIDKAFAPMADQPRNERPLMASLHDLHREMNDPGSLTRQASAPSAPPTPASISNRIAEDSLKTRDGSSPPAHLVEARQAALDLLHSDPKSPASDPRSSSSTIDPSILTGISAHHTSTSHHDPAHAKWLSHVQEDASAGVNDWVGASEDSMTPRERMLVQALYGVEEKMRPGLAMVSGEVKKLEVERERARLETERLEFEELRREIREDRIWREEQESRLVERIE